MKTLIILHGWGSSKERWNKVKERLEKEKIEVIVPDLPGFKTEIREVWNLDKYLDWFYKISSSREKFFLLGHSFGGRIAIKFAQKYPEKLEGLILVSAAGLKKPLSIFQSFFLKISSFILNFPILNKSKSFFRGFYYRYILRKTDYLEAQGFMKETFKEVIEENLAPLLPGIKTPTMIIWGKNDKITPLSDAYFMNEKITGSKLELLDNNGHAPYLDAPELLAKKILNFLNR